MPRLITPDKTLALPVEFEREIELLPLEGNVRVLVDPVQDTTTGGIALPTSTARNRLYYTGVVGAIGKKVEEIEVGWRVAWNAAEPPLAVAGPNGRTIILDQLAICARVAERGKA